MAQTLRIKSAGGLTKMTLSPRCRKKDGYQSRREKHNMSSAAQKYINNRAQHSQLEFSLAANVSKGDWFLVLTYDDAHLPSSWDAADRVMKAFCRKLRERRKPQWTMYYYNIERNHYSERPEDCHRWHHHIILPGDISLSVITELWGRGLVFSKRIRLDPDHTYGSLATYMLKESNEFPGKRGWRCSRGLKKPEEDVIIVPDDYVIEQPEGKNVMVLEAPEVSQTVYGRLQKIKFQVLDGYENPVVSSIKRKRKNRRRKTKAAT